MSASDGTHTYYVWRRNDGYVSASANRMPNGWKHAGGEVTFTQLLVTPHWTEAWDRIEKELAATTEP